MTILFDLSSFEFASDRLSILELRKLFPNQFDRLRSEAISSLSLDDVLSSLIDLERKLAEQAFDAVLGRSGRWDRYRDSQREALASEYVRFGLAQGPVHAEQLIRDMETRAAQQAQALGGRDI